MDKYRINTTWIISIVCLLFLLGCKQSTDKGEQTSKEITIDSPIYKRLSALGYDTISHRIPPKANFIAAVQTGNLIYLSGHGPLANEQPPITGKVGLDMSIKEANEAAKLTALLLLHSLEEEIGDLTKVKKIIRVFGMVNASDDFKQHPAVINGCSDLLVAVFGEEIGKHTRAAVGMSSLPFNIPVEIEMIVEVE